MGYFVVSARPPSTPLTSPRRVDPTLDDGAGGSVVGEVPAGSGWDGTGVAVSGSAGREAVVDGTPRVPPVPALVCEPLPVGV